MTAAPETVRLPARRDPVSAKILRSVGKLPLQIFLAVIALLWLVPTIGLFITSIQPSSEIATAGWWKLFAHPSQATFSHYSDLFHNAGLTGAMKTTAYIAVGNTLLVVIVAALAGYAFAWLEFPGRDWLFIGVDRAPRGAAADGADPDVQALRHVRHRRHDLERDPLPRRVRAARSPSSSCATSSSGYRRTSSNRPASTGPARSGSSYA